MKSTPDLTHIDPTKLDFAMDIRHLSREIIITVKVLDDKQFTALANEAASLYADGMAEFAKIKQDLKKLNP
jgi:hypothetical protein